MGFSESPLAYDDIREAFDRALRVERGIKIRCRTHGAAVALRSRMNKFRYNDRKENAKIYDTDHAMHGRSIYDKLSIVIPPKDSEESQTIFLRKRTAEDLGVEISDIEVEQVAEGPRE